MAKNLSKLKHKLEKEEKKIQKELKGLERPPEFGPETYDEESHESQEFGNQLSIAQSLKNRLNSIGTALAKIVRGKYGVCERCGKKISDEILKIAPESRLCQSCKKALKARA